MRRLLLLLLGLSTGCQWVYPFARERNSGDTCVPDTVGTDSPARLDGPARSEMTQPDRWGDGPPTAMRQWQLATPSAKPPPLWGGKLVYWPKTKRLLLYGGAVDRYNTYSARMWEYDGMTWTTVCKTCPPGPRAGHALVLDAQRDVLVLFGGHLGNTGEGTYFNDLWEYNGAAWTQRSPGGTLPLPRGSVYAAYDKARGRMVVFGGEVGSNQRSDWVRDEVFEYDGTSWFGPFTPEPRPSASQDEGTGATYAEGQALHPAVRNRVVIFGGLPLGSAQAIDETWAWDGTTWTQVCVTCTGQVRGNVALTYDPASGRLVLAGGWTGTVTNEMLADTFELRGSGWVSGPIVPGGARDAIAVAYSPALDRVVLYGGFGACASSKWVPCDLTAEYVRVP